MFNDAVPDYVAGDNQHDSSRQPLSYTPLYYPAPTIYNQSTYALPQGFAPGQHTYASGQPLPAGPSGDSGYAQHPTSTAVYQEPAGYDSITLPAGNVKFSLG